MHKAAVDKLHIQQRDQVEPHHVCSGQLMLGLSLALAVTSRQTGRQTGRQPKVRALISTGWH